MDNPGTSTPKISNPPRPRQLRRRGGARPGRDRDRRRPPRDRPHGLALARAPDGAYRTTEPIPVHGDWKATVRLAGGREVLGPPIRMPTDPELPWAPGVRAKARFVRSFVPDHQLLQREQKPGVPGWLKTVAPLAVPVLSLGFVGLLAWGLTRLGRTIEPPRGAWTGRAQARQRPAAIPSGARP